MNKLRSLFAQADRRAVNQNESCAAVAYGLSNLFGCQRLKFFRLAANQDDCFGMSDIVMRRERSAQIVEERLDAERVGNRVVFRFDDLGRKLSQTIKRLVCKASTADYAERVATMRGDNRIELFTRSGNTESPDETWSAWSAAYTNANGSPVTSPKTRYIQWRAVLTGKGDGPVLTSVTAAYPGGR